LHFCWLLLQNFIQFLIAICPEHYARFVLAIAALFLIVHRIKHKMHNAMRACSRLKNELFSLPSHSLFLLYTLQFVTASFKEKYTEIVFIKFYLFIRIIRLNY